MQKLECVSIGIYILCLTVAILSFSFYLGETADIIDTVVSPVRIIGYECSTLQRPSVNPELETGWTTNCSYNGSTWDKCLDIPTSAAASTQPYFPDYEFCTLNNASKWSLVFRNATQNSNSTPRNYSDLYTFAGYKAPDKSQRDTALYKGQNSVNATGWGYETCAGNGASVPSCPALPLELVFEDDENDVRIAMDVDVEQSLQLHMNTRPGAQGPWCGCSGLQEIKSHSALYEYSEADNYTWHPQAQALRDGEAWHGRVAELQEYAPEPDALLSSAIGSMDEYFRPKVNLLSSSIDFENIGPEDFGKGHTWCASFGIETWCVGRDDVIYVNTLTWSFGTPIVFPQISQGVPNLVCASAGSTAIICAPTASAIFPASAFRINIQQKTMEEVAVFHQETKTCHDNQTYTYTNSFSECFSVASNVWCVPSRISSVAHCESTSNRTIEPQLQFSAAVFSDSPMTYVTASPTPKSSQAPTPKSATFAPATSAPFPVSTASRNSSYLLSQDYGLGSQKYTTSVVALDGRIFAAPYSASKVLVIDPFHNTSYLLPQDYGTGSHKYRTSAVALDGRIFAPPYNARKVLVIDPSYNTSYLLPQDYGTGLEKFYTSVVAPDGRIFSPPNVRIAAPQGGDCWPPCGSRSGICPWCGEGNLCCRQGYVGGGCDGSMGGWSTHACITPSLSLTQKVLVIDPTSNTSYLLPEDYGMGSSKYRTSAVAQNGLIFAPPYGTGALKVLAIDPSRNTSYLLPQDYGSGSSKYLTSVVALDGRIFALPFGASKVLVIDPSQNTSYLLSEDFGTGSSKYATSEVAADGRIFAPPYTGASKVLVIDPSHNTSYQLVQDYGTGSEKYLTCARGLNGRIYAPPYRTGATETVLVADPFRNVSYASAKGGARPYSYAGCFRDGNARALFSYSTLRNDLTTSKCASVCSSYDYFGTENSNECFCGNVFRNWGASTGCSYTCTGNSAEICGGPWALSIHLGTLYSTIALAPDGRLFAAPYTASKVLVIDPGPRFLTKSPTAAPSTRTPVTRTPTTMVPTIVTPTRVTRIELIALNSTNTSEPGITAFVCTQVASSLWCAHYDFVLNATNIITLDTSTGQSRTVARDIYFTFGTRPSAHTVGTDVWLLPGANTFSTTVVKINTITETTTAYPAGRYTPTSPSHDFQHCTVVGTSIWCPGNKDQGMVRIDTTTGQLTYSYVPAAFGPCAKSYGDNVWCVAMQSTDFALRINSNLGAISYVGHPRLALNNPTYGSCTLAGEDILCAPAEFNRWLRFRAGTEAPTTVSPSASTPTLSPVTSAPTATHAPTSVTGAPTSSAWVASVGTTIGRFCEPHSKADLIQTRTSPKTYRVTSPALWESLGSGSSPCNFSCACVPLSDSARDAIKRGVLSRLKIRSNKGLSTDFCAPWKDLPPFVCTQTRHLKPNSLFSSLSLALGNVTLFYFAITVCVAAWFSDPLGCRKPNIDDQEADDEPCSCCCCCTSCWCCRCLCNTCRACFDTFFSARIGERDGKVAEPADDGVDTKESYRVSVVAEGGQASSMEMSSFGGRRTDRTFS